MSKALMIISLLAGFIAAPIIIRGQLVSPQPPAIMESNATSTTAGSRIVDFLVGDSCLVPVYHTNFAFPPEGGKIVRIGNQMFFVKDYLPGCENAGAGGIIIR